MHLWRGEGEGDAAKDETVVVREGKVAAWRDRRGGGGAWSGFGEQEREVWGVWAVLLPPFSSFSSFKCFL
jgi:hypothetical protein